MITKLEIKGFKSLVDVSIELGAVNVFIGANGSGKSNLLEAVGFLSAIVSGSLEAESIRYRGVRHGSPQSYLSSMISKSAECVSLFARDTCTSFNVEFGADDAQPSRWAIRRESGAFEGIEVLRRTRNGVGVLNHKQMDEIPVGNHSPSKSIVGFWALYFAYNKDQFQPDPNSSDIPILGADFFEPLDLYGIFTPNTPQLRGSGTDIQREPLGLGGSGLGQAIGDMLKLDPEKLGPFDLEDVYELIDWADSLTIDERSDPSTRLRIGDRFMGNGHKTVSLLEASEGALYVLFLLALVGHEDSPRFFAVDNFDQALHPRLARKLTRVISDQIICDGSRQMLATTHNPLVLDGLDLLDDRVRLFTVDRDSNGASQVQRVQVTPELMARAEEGFSLSELWNMGRLGGIPKYF
jgi:energy-coupling factor transporter ATP-binding protein EcfA2